MTAVRGWRSTSTPRSNHRFTSRLTGSPRTSEPKGADVGLQPAVWGRLPLRPNWQAEAAAEGQWSGSLWALPPPLPLHSAARTPRVCAHSCSTCLLYTSDAADEEDSVDLGGRRI